MLKALTILGLLALTLFTAMGPFISDAYREYRKGRPPSKWGKDDG